MNVLKIKVMTTEEFKKLSKESESFKAALKYAGLKEDCDFEQECYYNSLKVDTAIAFFKGVIYQLEQDINLIKQNKQL